MRRPIHRGARRPVMAVCLLLAGLWAAGQVLEARGQVELPARPDDGQATAPAPEPGVREVPAPPAAGEGWFARAARTRPLPTLPERVTRAFVIPIRGMINQSMLDSIKRKMLRARAAGAELIIFDMDTPGGTMDAADRIVKLIRAESRDIRTVTFVNPDALSAGAWIALSTHEIVMSPSAKMGAAAPISMIGEIPEVMRAKLESDMRSDFRLAAEQNGYPAALAEAMISRELEIWLVQDVQTGEQRYVRRYEYAGLVQSLPDQPELAPRPDARWRVLRVIVPKSELLTLNRAEAQKYGFTKQGADDLQGVAQLYNIVEGPVVLADNWSERVAQFLTSPAITGLLVLGVLLFGYIEFHTPGFGVPGIVALSCLAVLIGSRYVTHLAQTWEIVLFVVGLILLVIELFVTPGFGVLGITGLVLCVIGMLAMLVGNAPDELPVPTSGLLMEAFLKGLVALGLGFLGGVALSIVVARFLPRVPVANRLMLGEVKVEPSAPASERVAIRHVAPGDIGVVEAPCRPVGIARFGERLADVVAEGEFIPRGTPVVVMRNEGNRLVVRPAGPGRATT